MKHNINKGMLILTCHKSKEGALDIWMDASKDWQTIMHMFLLFNLQNGFIIPFKFADTSPQHQSRRDRQEMIWSSLAFLS